MFPALLAKTNFGLDHATLADVAAILCEDEACLAPIANAANETTGEPRWIAGALIHALWRKAGVAPQVMSSVLKAWPEIVASLEAVMCFRANAAAEESDPFMFYQPVAAHSIPVAGLDEYIDLVENRFIIWRRPSIDRKSLGKAMFAGRRSDNDAAYLAALRSLQARPTYQTTGLGFTDGSTFFHNEWGRNLAEQALESSVLCNDRSGLLFENSYVCKTSINVSIVVRAFKRKALGLTVRP